jgi:hypothetical protein
MEKVAAKRKTITINYWGFRNALQVVFLRLLRPQRAGANIFEAAPEFLEPKDSLLQDLLLGVSIIRLVSFFVAKATLESCVYSKKRLRIVE